MFRNCMHGEFTLCPGLFVVDDADFVYVRVNP
jgi:hypothetical protein